MTFPAATLPGHDEHTAAPPWENRAFRFVPAVFTHHRKLVIALLVLAALAAVAVAWQMRSTAPAEYVTSPVTRGTVSQSLSATGSVNPVLTITVGSYVSGVIQSINCDFNTQVKKGQLCAKIDPRPYQTVVDQDKASLATAKAQLDKDSANLSYTAATKQRYTNLYDQKAVSEDARDVAINNAAQAKAQVELDQASVAERAAALDAAQVNLGYTDIVSPVNGTVVSRNVTMGQTVAASFQTPTLFLIATDLSAMEVDTNVSESDIGGVRVGNRAEFTVEAFPQRKFIGTVAQVRQAPQTVQNVVTYDVIVTVPNPQFLLKPGMTATVRIITNERLNVLRVPNQALRYVPGGLANGAGQSTASQVWALREGKLARLSVTTGLEDDSMTEITGGALKPGDQIVVSERSTGTAQAGATQPTPRF
jgi:HlyD family secretion protein